MDNSTAVLIIATGRSGSTTIKNVINLAPNVNICGENSSTIFTLLEYVNKMTTLYNYRSTNKIDERYNSFNLDVFKKDIRTLIKNTFCVSPDNVMWGFKEVEWSGKIHLLNTFLQLFPNTKIIINVAKDVSLQSNSVLHLRNQNGLKMLRNYTGEITYYYKLNKSRGNVFLFNKEDITNVEMHRKMYEFLEISSSFDSSKVSDFLRETTEIYKHRPYIASDNSYINILKEMRRELMTIRCQTMCIRKKQEGCNDISAKVEDYETPAETQAAEALLENIEDPRSFVIKLAMADEEGTMALLGIKI